MILKIIYTLFLGLLVALFIGLGIDAFYVGPIEPDYPSELRVQKPGCEDYPELKATQEKYDETIKTFDEKNKIYNRNVSILSMIFAIIILVTSLTLFYKIKMMADGILLGGVFTTAYSIIRGLMSENSKFRFLIVTCGLIIALALGYMKFIHPKENAQQSVK